MTRPNVSTSHRTRKAAVLAACQLVESDGAQRYVWDNGQHSRPASRRYLVSYRWPTYGPFYGPIRRANLDSYRQNYGGVV